MHGPPPPPPPPSSSSAPWPCQYLRILNLSGNHIRTVENLEGLTSLIELNLCRNNVEQVFGLGDLTALRRLFLSTNNIDSFHGIQSLLQVPWLEELTLFKNHVASFASYRSRIVLNCAGLKVRPTHPSRMNGGLDWGGLDWHACAHGRTTVSSLLAALRANRTVLCRTFALFLSLFTPHNARATRCLSWLALSRSDP
jgi:Leucine-rich repeat (LRR) protein